MTLPPQVQTLVDQIVQAMGLQATRPSALEINMDGEGIVQDVKPRLVYRRSAAPAAPQCCGITMNYEGRIRMFICGTCKKHLDKDSGMRV